jgi:Flp pilus assembly protein TadG
MMGTTKRSILFRRRARRRTSNRQRCGLAAVELALCLPVLLATALGLIETSNLVFVQSRIQSVAYEGARIATRPATATTNALTSAQVTTACNTLLAQLGVSGGQITLNPSTITGLAPQTMVTVTVTAPLSQNSVTSFVLNGSMTLSAQATMIIE